MHTIITLAMVKDINAFIQDLGHDDSPVPGPQFFDVDSDGQVSADSDFPDPDLTTGGPVAALVFSNPESRTFIKDDMLVPWSSINGDPDPDPQDSEKAVYLSRDLFALVVQSN